MRGESVFQIGLIDITEQRDFEFKLKRENQLNSESNEDEDLYLEISFLPNPRKKRFKISISQKTALECKKRPILRLLPTFAPAVLYQSSETLKETLQLSFRIKTLGIILISEKLR